MIKPKFMQQAENSALALKHELFGPILCLWLVIGVSSQTFQNILSQRDCLVKQMTAH